MRKVLYLITQSEHGGAQAYVKSLAEALRDDYSIAVAAGEEAEENWLKQEIGILGLSFKGLKHLKRAISPIDDILATIEILNLIKEEKPDIIHLNSSKISILGSLAWRLLPKDLRTRIKVVYTVHGWVFLEPLPFLKKLFFHWAEKLTAVYKHKLICVSEHDRLSALKERICPEKKLVTIHNGISLPNGSKRPGLSLLNSQALGAKHRIVTIANLYPTKGLEYLVEAAKILKDKGYDFSISIIGEGHERSKLETMILASGLKDKAFLLGAIPDASLCLSSFDIYACSSVKEGLSYTIIEAMLSGLPIVATNVGGNGELITDKTEGLLVEAKNPDALAEALERLISHREEAAIFGINARIKAETDFNQEQMVSKTKGVYGELLA